MNPAGDDVVIVAGARTPFGRFRGALTGLSAVELGAVAMRAAIAQAQGIEPGDIDAVIVGQVLQAGAGQNPARQAAVAAGVPLGVPGMTINKVCLSGLTAVIDGARLIRTGEAAVVLAGGQESMTNAPHMLVGARLGLGYGDATLVDAVARDGLSDAFDGHAMGLATEEANVGDVFVSREDQD